MNSFWLTVGVAIAMTILIVSSISLQNQPKAPSTLVIEVTELGAKKPFTIVTYDNVVFSNGVYDVKGPIFEFIGAGRYTLKSGPENFRVVAIVGEQSNIVSLKRGRYIYQGEAADMFKNATSLKEVMFPPEFKGTTDLSGMFEGCTSLEKMDIFYNFTTSVAKIDRMFKGCTSLVSLKIPIGFGTGAVSAESTFSGCSNLTNLSLPKGFGSTVTGSFSEIFKDCASFTTLTLPEEFMINAAGSGASAFEGCGAVSSLLLPVNFASKATNLDSMFSGCTALTGIFTLPVLFGAKATSAISMMNGCSNITSVVFNLKFLDSIKDDVNNTNITNFFAGSTKITGLTFASDFVINEHVTREAVAAPPDALPLLVFVPVVQAWGIPPTDAVILPTP